MISDALRQAMDEASRIEQTVANLEQAAIVPIRNELARLQSRIDDLVAEDRRLETLVDEKVQTMLSYQGQVLQRVQDLLNRYEAAYNEQIDKIWKVVDGMERDWQRYSRQVGINQ